MIFEHKQFALQINSNRMDLEKHLILLCRHYIISDFETCSRLYNEIHVKIGERNNHLCYSFGDDLFSRDFWEKQTGICREIRSIFNLNFSSCATNVFYKCNGTIIYKVTSFLNDYDRKDIIMIKSA